MRSFDTEVVQPRADGSSIPHNELMLRSRSLIVSVASCFLLVHLSISALFASPRTAPAKTRVRDGIDYAFALAAANRFLQAWQGGDAENGIVLLTAHAKEKISPEDLEALFSSPPPAAYEIVRGKLLRRGRYSFPVVLLGPAPKRGQASRRFSNMLVVDAGNNDWAIDKLP